jgi:hypothetical protein
LTQLNNRYIPYGKLKNILKGLLAGIRFLTKNSNNNKTTGTSANNYSISYSLVYGRLSVRNRHLRLFIAWLLCAAFVYTPILQAAQLSLPSGDLIAPEVSHEVIPGTLEAGSSLQIKATVTDNVGVKSVTLFYRTKGTQEYKRIAMNRLDNADEYAVTLGKSELVEPGIEYYIQAMDLAGNSLLHGYSFSPLTVSVVPPAAPKAEAPAAVAKEAQPAGETIREEPQVEKKKSKTWLWIALGALAVGAIAAAAGGGGGGDDGGGGTGTVVINSPTP